MGDKAKIGNVDSPFHACLVRGIEDSIKRDVLKELVYSKLVRIEYHGDTRADSSRRVLPRRVAEIWQQVINFKLVLFSAFFLQSVLSDAHADVTLTL